MGMVAIGVVVGASVIGLLTNRSVVIGVAITGVVIGVVIGVVVEVVVVAVAVIEVVMIGGIVVEEAEVGLVVLGGISFEIHDNVNCGSTDDVGAAVVIVETTTDGAGKVCDVGVRHRDGFVFVFG